MKLQLAQRYNLQLAGGRWQSSGMCLMDCHNNLTRGIAFKLKLASLCGAALSF
jgi:hypothetical protein